MADRTDVREAPIALYLDILPSWGAKGQRSLRLVWRGIYRWHMPIDGGFVWYMGAVAKP